MKVEDLEKEPTMKLEPANLICPACGNGNYMRHMIGKNVGWLNLKCINCNAYFNLEDLLQRQERLSGAKTNYDTIVSKSPEELAQWLCDVAGFLSMYEGKTHAILKWLKEETP